MKKMFIIIFSIIGLVILVVISINSAQSDFRNSYVKNFQINPDAIILLTQESQANEKIETIKIQDVIDINDLPIIDNMNLYKYDDPSSIVHMYITVREGNSSDNTDHTWEEVNQFTNYFSEGTIATEPGKAEVIFQIGDEHGPAEGEFGFGELITNGIINIRGNSSSVLPQKSYKIELRDRAGEWRGLSTIILNKHVWDITRIRNKLSFDLMATIPDLVSMRTQFVRLFVKDETSSKTESDFVDYGLFTQIENINKRYLQNHLLDSNGHLYKANSFDFGRYPDNIHLESDVRFSNEFFSSQLAIKGNRNHTKLIQMLDDLNNYDIPIKETFEKYFNSNNYFTWMAFNLLIGNFDTRNQNFYLYSPQNADVWYFFPWDYDGALKIQEIEQYSGIKNQLWETGIANYWDVILHRRVLSHEDYRNRLVEKTEELLEIITPDRLSEYLNIYRITTEPYIYSIPDLLISSDFQKYDVIMNGLPNEIEINYQQLLNSLTLPMPFHIKPPQIVGDKLILEWEEAYTFNRHSIVYFVEVSKDRGFTEILSETTTYLTTIEIDSLLSGTYFWRVTAINKEGLIMLPFENIQDSDGNFIDGTSSFFISADFEIID